MSQPTDTGAGTFEYRLTLDVEGKAVLEAALGPLSAPAPVDEERDLRTSDRRRGDALLTLVRRAVAAGDAAGKTNKTTLLLTMGYDDLKAGLGAATTVGGLDAGTHLAPETVRRLCCGGSVIPLVLGGPSEVLDWGLERRFFTPAQTRRLWLRDGGCTYPGCDAPPQWTDGHHLLHWADHGPSDLGNAALLCERHHTVVHTAATPAASCATGRGNRWSGTWPAAPTTTSSPDGARATPRPNRRDPAPHPASAGGVIGMSDAAPVRLLSVRLPVGALAVGVLAVGALAVGALAVGVLGPGCSSGP